MTKEMIKIDPITFATEQGEFHLHLMVAFKDTKQPSVLVTKQDTNEMGLTCTLTDETYHSLTEGIDTEITKFRLYNWFNDLLIDYVYGGAALDAFEDQVPELFQVFYQSLMNNSFIKVNPYRTKESVKQISSLKTNVYFFQTLKSLEKQVEDNWKEECFVLQAEGIYGIYVMDPYSKLKAKDSKNLENIGDFIFNVDINLKKTRDKLVGLNWRFDQILRSQYGSIKLDLGLVANPDTFSYVYNGIHKPSDLIIQDFVKLMEDTDTESLLNFFDVSNKEDAPEEIKSKVVKGTIKLSKYGFGFGFPS